MDPQKIIEFGQRVGLYDPMHTAFGWPIVEIIHYLSIAVLFGTVGLFDLRMLGLAKGVPMPALNRLVPWGVAAFCVNAVTGAVFFINAADQYLYNPAFQLKMLCIAIAGINVAAFYLLMARRVGETRAGDEAPTAAKLIAAISLIAWISVVMFGRLITYFRPPYHWCFWC